MRGICFPLFCAVALLLWPHGRARAVEETKVQFNMEETKVQAPSKVFCDNKDVVAGVDLALDTHNARLLQGNQLALYQIVEASKVVNESTTLIDLVFLVRESDCPVGGDKEWRDCDYLPQPDSVAPSLCRTVVSRRTAEESLAVVSVECRPHVERTMVGRRRAQCLGCPQEIGVANEDLKEPMSYSLSKFNMQDDSSHHFLLQDILSATRQVVAGFRYDIEFNLEKSNCSKSDFKELTEECHPDETEPEFAKCNSTVYIAPWRREEPEAHVNCERVLQMGISRRRPPGWSPLRHLQNPSFAAESPPRVNPGQPLAPPPPKPNADRPPAPRKGTAEKESSESQEVTPTSAAATQNPADLLADLLPAAPEPAKPFNCPAKPWKPFVPLTPPPPTPQNEPTPAPELTLGDIGTFSDLDLVG